MPILRTTAQNEKRDLSVAGFFSNSIGRGGNLPSLVWNLPLDRMSDRITMMLFSPAFNRPVFPY